MNHSYYDDDMRAADNVTGCLLSLIFSLFWGLGKLISGERVRVPKGTPVGYLRTTLGIKHVAGIPPQQRFQHVAVIGATGSGKTTLLKHLIAADVRDRYGIAVIDPKGDLAEVLALIPPARAQDVVIIDPTDREHPVALNLLEQVEPDLAPLATSQLVSVFQKVLGSTWGVRMENILRNALLALVETPTATLMDLRTFLINEQFRETCLAHCTNPAVLAYWREEFAIYTHGQQMQAVAPILNRIGHFITYPMVRNMLCQRRSTISFKSVMDQGKILLVSLPPTLGEDVADFLGSLIVAKLQLAAMQRAGLPPESRRPFILYVDEAQHFVANNTFERIITEARAMNVGFVLATQFLERLPADLRNTITKNVATMLICYVDHGRHQLLYQQPQDAGTADLVLTPYPPAANPDTTLSQAIRAESRRKYARRRHTVEQELFQQTVTPNGALFVPEPFWSTEG